MDRFDDETLTALRKSKHLAIRAGTKAHRFIHIWAVIVERRVFVRSWTLKPDGWFATLRREPHAVVQIGDREIEVRAVRTRSERLKKAVDDAYAETYTTPSARQYVTGFRRDRERRDSTTELIPL
jgi:hypothetical protein